MTLLFDFKQQRTAGQALLFYIGHFLIALVSGALAGMAAATHARGASVHSVASFAGELVAIIYCCTVCVAVITQRNLSYKYYALLAIVLPVAFLLGGTAGLVIPAILTTRPGAAADDRFSGYRSGTQIVVPRRPGEAFGRRSSITR
jgi:peptidoglycan/LPS O-acetylase OafA/YrhL